MDSHADWPPRSGWAARPRPLLRFVPTILEVHRATSVIDVGLAITSTVLGIVLGVLTAVVLACWRITTPASAPPLSVSVRPVGLPASGD